MQINLHMEILTMRQRKKEKAPLHHPGNQALPFAKPFRSPNIMSPIRPY